MSTLRLSLGLTIFLSVHCFVLAQAQQRTIEELPAERVIPRNERFVVSGGMGLMPTFLMGGTQDKPVLNFAAQYYLTTRLAVGLAFSQSQSTSEPYIDPLGVSTWATSRVSHIGGRLTGTIVRKGPVELYGGLQLGVNTTRQTQRHEFAPGMPVENHESYIAERPDPFGEPSVQVSAIGLFGMSVEVLPHAHFYTEIGNNLSLVSAGVEARF